MLDQHIFLNSMCICIVTVYVVICFSDSNAYSAPGASGVLGVCCCFCEVLL